MPQFCEEKTALNQGMTRRRFFGLGTTLILSGMAPGFCFAAGRTAHSPERSLSFYNMHTWESVSTVYWSQGKYLLPALKEISHVLRDHRTGEVKRISPRLLDLLYAIKVKLGAKQSFHVVSGYRSPKTNALLRSRSKRVAKNSLHMSGEAIDTYVPGYRISGLRRTAIRLRGGGVGYYPRSNFVHIDVGPVRVW